jgi:BlaR1 peptidase M56
VRSARVFYRVSLALGLAGAAVTAVVVAVALRALDFALPTVAELRSACEQVLPAALRVDSVFVLASAAFGAVVGVRAARSIIAQLRARRRLMDGLVVLGPLADGPVDASVIDDPLPQAFCVGHLRPRIYVSSGACERLDAAELAAVLAHEAHHARRRDPLRLAIVRVLADAVFFLPVLRRLSQRYRALAELAADEAAVRACRDRAPLASALLAFEDGPQPGAVGIEPERVDQLLGQRPRWELPLSLVSGALITLGGLVGLVVVAARDVAPGATDLALLSAEACMIAMTLAPIMLAAGLLVLTGQALAQARR